MEDEPLPGEQLIESLFKLKEKLERSGVQRTYGLREAMGVECEYYWKSLNVFLKRDYKELKQLVEKAKEWFDRCEQEDTDCGGKGK